MNSAIPNEWFDKNLEAALVAARERESKISEITRTERQLKCEGWINNYIRV